MEENNPSKNESWTKKKFGMDVFWIAVVTFFLGVMVAFLLWNIQRAIKNAADFPQITPSKQVNLPPKKEPVALTLTIANPEDNDVTNQKTVTLKGKTSKSSTVAIVGGLEDLVIEASGDFTAQVDLNEGLNELTVTAFDDTGVESSQSLAILYTTEQI